MRFLGHSTVLVEIDGVQILTDPVLLPRTAQVLRRVGQPVDPNLCAGVDLIVISHLHADHLDLPSLRRLGPTTPIVVPRGAGAYLAGKGFGDVTELGPGDEHQHKGVTVTATFADHDGLRAPFGPRALAVGYVLEGGGSRVYFAGDTDLFPEMEEIGGDGLDAALIPVWGWGPNLGPGHLDPTRAAEATRRLNPRVAVPIHWGTLHPYGIGRWMRNHLVDPPVRYARAVRALGLPTVVAHTEPGARVGEP
jgi:L-ascorbate metabolism protein UlaG (beta-lactamase superfamily)